MFSEERCFEEICKQLLESLLLPRLRPVLELQEQRGEVTELHSKFAQCVFVYVHFKPQKVTDIKNKTM